MSVRFSMKPGGLYWANTVLDDDGDCGVLFGFEPSGFVRHGEPGILVNNGFPIILLSISSYGPYESVFFCLTLGGVGWRSAPYEKFASWFVSDLMLLNETKKGA